MFDFWATYSAWWCSISLRIFEEMFFDVFDSERLSGSARLVWLRCAKSWFTEWPLANAANWKACSDEFVRFERWETLEGVDLIFVFLLVAALEHRISNSVSVMEFRRQRQECFQSMSWQRCWVCFLSRSCHQGSEVHFYRNGMTGRNRTANVGDAECQLTTMCVRQILLNVFKLDVFHRWHYPFHAVRSWWLMICTYVAEKLQQYRASRSFSTQVCVDTFRMLISFKAVYLRQDDILFCSWTSCNAWLLSSSFKRVTQCLRCDWLSFWFCDYRHVMKGVAQSRLDYSNGVGTIDRLWHDSRLGFSERWWSQPLRLRLFQGWLVFTSWHMVVRRRACVSTKSMKSITAG